MKRKEEISIIVNSLVKEGLIDEGKSDRARAIVGGSIKTINARKYSENHKCPLDDIKEAVRDAMKDVREPNFGIDIMLDGKKIFEAVKRIEVPKEPSCKSGIRIVKSGVRSALVIGKEMVDLTSFEIKNDIVATTLLLKIVCDPNELEIALSPEDSGDK